MSTEEFLLFSLAEFVESDKEISSQSDELIILLLLFCEEEHPFKDISTSEQSRNRINFFIITPMSVVTISMENQAGYLLLRQ